MPAKRAGMVKWDEFVRALLTTAMVFVLRVRQMKDGDDEQRMARLLQVVSFLQCAFGIEQHVGDVLDVTDLPCARVASLSSGL